MMLIFGIIGNAYLPGHFNSKCLLLILSVLVLVSTKLFINKWIGGISVFGTAILCFSFLLGVLAAETQSLQFDNGHYSNFVTEEENYFKGKVLTIGGNTSYAQITVEVQSVEVGDKIIYADGLLKLITPIQELVEGNVIEFYAEPRVIKSVENPFAFNYAEFLAKKEIYYQAFVNDIKVTSLEQGRLQKTREDFLKHIDRLPLSDESKILLQAMLLGEKSQLKAMGKVFRATGTSHVLAISGLHVGIVATLLHFLFMWIPNRFLWLKSLLVILGVWLFCMVSGMAPSTLRASIMISSFMIGKAFNIQGLSYNFCFLSGFFMLMYNPAWIYDIGFQFSFLAIIGILFFFDFIYSALILRGFSDKIWQMIVLSISAQLTLMPLSLYYFHEFPILFIPASVIAIPATFLLISLSVLGLFVHSIGGFVFVFELLDWFNNTFLQLLSLLASRDEMVLTNLFPTVGEILVYYLCLMGISSFYITRKKVYLTAFVLGFILLLGSQFYLNSAHNQAHIICYADRKDFIIDIIQSGTAVGLVEAGVKSKKLPYVRDPMRQKLAVIKSKEYILKGAENHEFQVGDFSIGIWNTAKAEFRNDTLDLLVINRKIEASERIPNSHQIIDFELNENIITSDKVLREQALVIKL